MLNLIHAKLFCPYAARFELLDGIHYYTQFDLRYLRGKIKISAAVKS